MATITTRAGKGTPLTNAEVDANFTNLNDFKVEQTSTTGSAKIPTGTEAQRDGTPEAGLFRFNTDTQSFEGYNGTEWGAVGGGGGGGGGPVPIGVDWTAEQVGDDLVFRYSGTAYMKLLSNGDLVVSGDIRSNETL